MVDTVRTVAALQAILADNTTGDISPQDLRDMLVSLEALSPSVGINGSVVAQGIGFGDFYMLGYYDCPLADSNRTQAAPTQTYGTANGAYGAHVIAVAAAAGVTDGTDLVLTVTGTSITDAGVRTAADSEILVASCTASATNQYYETAKKWIGLITYTLSSTGGTAFNYDFNYGFAAYEDQGNTNFNIDHFVFEWLGGANDPSFDIELHHHKPTGWTYHATAFDPGPTPLYKLSTQYVTERQIISGDYGRWKMAGLADAIAAATDEGIIVHIKTTVNNSVQWCNGTISVKLQPI